MAHYAEEHTVNTDRCLYIVRYIALVLLWIEVLDRTAAVLLVLRKVEIGTAVDTLNLLETEWHLKLDVGSSIGIVSHFLVIMITVVLITHTESLVPSQTNLLPILKPLHLSTRLAEELHLHLRELTHTEYELTGNNLVTESLTNLADTEWHLHTAGLLNTQVIYEDTLSSLRTEIYLACSIACRTHLGPVLGTADRTNNTLILDNLLQHLQVRTLHSLSIAGMEVIKLLLVLQNARISCTELSLIKAIAEALLSLGNLLGNLLLILSHVILDEHIGTITLLCIAVINQRVVESIYVSRCLPYCRVHEDSCIETNNVLVQQYHTLPPVLLDIVFELNTILTIVINGSQAIINFTTWEHEAIFLTMAYNFLKNIFLCHD